MAGACGDGPRSCNRSSDVRAQLMDGMQRRRSSMQLPHILNLRALFLLRCLNRCASDPIVLAKAGRRSAKDSRNGKHAHREDTAVSKGIRSVSKKGMTQLSDTFLRVHPWQKLTHLHNFFLDQRLNKTVKQPQHVHDCALEAKGKAPSRCPLFKKKRCVRRALMARVCGADHFFMCVHSSNLHSTDKLVDLDGWREGWRTTVLSHGSAKTLMAR